MRAPASAAAAEAVTASLAGNGPTNAGPRSALPIGDLLFLSTQYCVAGNSPRHVAGFSVLARVVRILKDGSHLLGLLLAPSKRAPITEFRDDRGMR
jgi:hypothetical protein